MSLLFSGSVMSNSVTPWTTALQASLSFTVAQSLLKLMPIELLMPSSHLVLCCPLLLLPSIFPSIRVFSNESVLHFRWPKYWSFSFSMSPSNENPGLISLRIDWFDLLVVQGTLKSLLQYHSSKASILWCSAFFMVQLSHPYMTTRPYKDLCQQSKYPKFKFLAYCCLVAKSCLTLCDPVNCNPSRLLCPWDFPGTSTGVGWHFILQEIEPGSPAMQADSLPLSYLENQQQLIVNDTEKTAH